MLEKTLATIGVFVDRNLARTIIMNRRWMQTVIEVAAFQEQLHLFKKFVRINCHFIT